MNLEEYCETIIHKLIKMAVCDEKERRIELRDKVESAIENIKEEFYSVANKHEDLIGRSVNLAKENKELKKELEFRKIAEGEDKDKIDHIVACMKAVTK